MQTLKKSKNGYLAITHFLTSVFVVPLITGIILDFVFRSLNIFSEVSLINSFVLGIIGLFIIWGGVVYSSKWITKKYYIDNSTKVVRIATIIMAVYLLISIFFIFILMNLGGGVDITTIKIDILFDILNVFVFYIISKKHIHNNT